MGRDRRPEWHQTVYLVFARRGRETEGDDTMNSEKLWAFIAGGLFAYMVLAHLRVLP